MSERPPREDYVRVTVSAGGYTFEPAVEFRDGDVYEQLAYRLRCHAHETAHEAMKGAVDAVSTFDARPSIEQIVDHLPDPMAAARRVGERIAAKWPDRAYFVEVWQEGREGFAQVFQPFGVPRNR